MSSRKTPAAETADAGGEKTTESGHRATAKSHHAPFDYTKAMGEIAAGAKQLTDSGVEAGRAMEVAERVWARGNGY